MDFSLDDSQRMLVESAERFVSDQLGLTPPERRVEPAALWQQLGEMGWLALPLPEIVGGLDGSFEDVALLMTALGGGVVPLPYVTTVILCGHLLATNVDCPAALTQLQRIALGESRVAFADIDGANGASASSNGPGGFVLSGSKRLCFDAPGSETLIVSARTQDGALALFAIDTDTPGVDIRSYPLIDGGEAGDVTFNDVRVAENRLLAVGPLAEERRREALDRARTANSAQAVGCLERALQVTANYVKEREQFGQPIGAFQAVKHMIAGMYIDAQEARSILYQALAFIDSPSERGRAVNAARLVIGEAARRITEQGIQLHGGYGLTDEFEIGHLYRKALALNLMFEAE